MRTVLITGTSKGLGKELLKVYLSEGWRVFALARKIESFAELKQQYSKSCFPIECDITDHNCSKLISETIHINGGNLDLLINNAGNAKKCFGIDNVIPEDLEDHFKVHVSGAFRVIKACLPFLKKANNALIIIVSSRKGSINNINSGTYRILLPYQIAKCAQNMLTVGLNQELKETNIKTYAIHPGNLKTDVAPPDADTDPSLAAVKIYHWIETDNKPPNHSFYSVMDDKILEW